MSFVTQWRWPQGYLLLMKMFHFSYDGPWKVVRLQQHRPSVVNHYQQYQRRWRYANSWSHYTEASEYTMTVSTASNTFNEPVYDDCVKSPESI